MRVYHFCLFGRSPFFLCKIWCTKGRTGDVYVRCPLWIGSVQEPRPGIQDHTITPNRKREFYPFSHYQLSSLCGRKTKRCMGSECSATLWTFWQAFCFSHLICQVKSFTGLTLKSLASNLCFSVNVEPWHDRGTTLSLGNLHQLRSPTLQPIRTVTNFPLFQEPSLNGTAYHYI